MFLVKRGLGVGKLADRSVLTVLGREVSGQWLMTVACVNHEYTPPPPDTMGELPTEK